MGQRHELTEEQWSRLEPLLPERFGLRGTVASRYYRWLREAAAS